MITGIDQVVLSGRLVKDATKKITNNKNSLVVVNFTIATTHPDKKVSYFDCACFGEYADGLYPYLNKGVEVLILAEVRQNRWKKDEQTTVNSVQFFVKSLKFIGNKPSNQTGGSTTSYAF